MTTLPTKPVVVRRWQIAGAFVVLTLSFVGVSIWLTHVADSAHAAAQSAHRAAAAARDDATRLAKVDRRIIKLRNGQIRLLCHAERNSTRALRRILLLAQGLSAQSHDLTPEQRRQTVSFYSRALPLARPIDCARLTKTKRTPKP